MVRGIPCTVAMLLTLCGSVTADFSHVEARDVSAEVGTPDGLVTWRLFAIFDEPFRQVLAVTGDIDDPLIFETNDPAGLFNDGGPFSGLKFEDFAQQPIAPAYDSWVTIGAVGFAANCTDYSPGFLDNNGVDFVIRGTAWSDVDDGWFDSHLGTQEMGPEVVIAQFTVGAGFGVRLSGTIATINDGTVCTPFCVFSPSFASLCLCPSDLDDDTMVALPDLMIILSRWGPCPAATCCREDLDGNGDVDFQDLLAVLSTWGPCPVPGACCFPDGSCEVARCLEGDECVRQGGAYQGPDTSCVDVACPPPAACCLPDGTCESQFEPACTAAGGIALGDDTVCVDVVCPQPGACCLPDGTCSQAAETGGPICAMAGGVYQGDDTTCGNTSCPLPGGCCLPDFTCHPVPESGCVDLGGVFLGEGTNCSVDCSRGACCLDDGSCVFVPVDTCGILGGSFAGNGVACRSIRCP